MLKRFVVDIYDILERHRGWRFFLMLMAILLPAIASLRLRFQENIADFLPVTEKEKEQLLHYQQEHNANQIVVLFSVHEDSLACPDCICDVIDAFSEYVPNAQVEADISMMRKQMAARYELLPYQTTPADTLRWDSLLTANRIHEQVALRRAQLQLPFAGTIAASIVNDPLGLFPEVLSDHITKSFTSYKGYMFSADHRLAFAFVPITDDNTETMNNAKVVDRLQNIINKLSEQYPHVFIRLNGAPVIAVGNSRQIKKDSLLAISIALVLIVLLLLRSLKSWRSMALIVASTGYGVLFALGVMGLVHPNMSLIVLGFSSVIIGIAVNYPLHLLVHRQYTNTARQTLQEVVMPLVVGNITTVGAFLTLVPLHSVALRDLGLFSSCLLVGTILFTIVFLPHFRFETPKFESFSRASKWINKSSTWHPENNRWVVTLVIVLTIVFAWFGRRATFDSNLSHINYMTSQQRADIEMINSMTGEIGESKDSLGTAELWNTFWANHRNDVIDQLHEAMSENGFRDDAFIDFERHIAPQIRCLEQLDMASLQSRLTTSLSDNFNYIGLACSIVVFVFLCFSFRKFKYAFAAFLPMVIAWIWIMGIMHLTGIQFNIVNIILATFIFGQGDDYTIFITEGLISGSLYNNEERLVQYKNSILLSALIMFIGIGSLIVARHPALHSLATVTMLGMVAVVLMADIVPPVVFKCFNLIKKHES